MPQRGGVSSELNLRMAISAEVKVHYLVVQKRSFR